MDITYIAITVSFFAAAIGYVYACAALGREDSTDSRGQNAD
jgi:hypothetical protein